MNTYVSTMERNDVISVLRNADDIIIGTANT